MVSIMYHYGYYNSVIKFIIYEHSETLVIKIDWQYFYFQKGMILEFSVLTLLW